MEIALIVIYAIGFIDTAISVYIMVSMAKMFSSKSSMDIVYSLLAGLLWPILMVTGIVSKIL